MNKSEMNELIKEIDIRIERVNNKLVPCEVLKVISAQGVDINDYFNIMKTYLEFFKEEVKSNKADETK